MKKILFAAGMIVAALSARAVIIPIQNNVFTTNATSSGVTGTNATVCGPFRVVGTYGATIGINTNAGPSLDSFAGYLRILGDQFGIQWYSQSGTTELMRLGQDNILRTKSPLYWIQSQVESPTSDHPQNVGTDAHFRFLSGSASAMGDMPIYPQSIYRRRPLPSVMFTTFYYTNGGTLNGKMWNVTNAAVAMKQNIGPWLKPYGHKPTVEVDAGHWYPTARDANGHRYWNTNGFPDAGGMAGFPFALNYIRTNDCLSEVACYYDTAEPSPFNTNSTTYGMITTPSYVQIDVDDLYRWKADSVRVQDVHSGGGYYRQLYAQWGDAILHVRNLPVIEGTNGANSSGAGGSYSNAMSLTILDAGFPAMPETPFIANAIFPDQPPSSGSGTDADDGIYWLRFAWTNAMWTIGKGHAFNVGTPSDNVGLTLEQNWAYYAAGAMLHLPWQWGYTYTPDGNTMQVVTNVDLLSAYFDVAQNPPCQVYDNGAGSTLCWEQPLANGDWLVLFGNQGASAASVGISWPQLSTSSTNWLWWFGQQYNADTNAVMSVRDIKAKSTLGAFSIGYTNASVPAHSLRLYRLSAGPRKIQRVKLADTARVNNTVTDDPDLTFPIAANEEWTFEFWCQYVTTAATPNVYIQLNGPASPSALMYSQEIYDGSGALNAGGASTMRYAYQVANAGPSAKATGYLMTKGKVINGATAGNITFQWSQQVTDAAHATTIKAGSYVIAERVLR